MTMAWVAVMKSGTIITAYCLYITGYDILFGAMDCVSICMSVMYVYVYVCTYIVHMNVAMCVYLYTYIVHTNVAMYVCNPSDMLQAQLGGTDLKVFKHPYKYYCQV